MISRRGFFSFLSGIGSAAAMIGSALPAASAELSLPNATPFEPVRVAGRVRWYDALKGYGFVTPDNGGADILLHVTCLRAGGYQTTHEGARIDCLALHRPNGMQVFRILSMEDSAAIEREEPEWDDSDRLEGGGVWEVRWYNRVRGFGFLSNKDSEIVFVNNRTIQQSGISFSEMRPGRSFVVRWKRTEKGKIATNVRRV